MPRRVFTARDLAPLRRVTERILEREPDAAVVAAAAAPIKRRIPKAAFETRIEARLPVELERATSREGVPLNAIALELRKEVPAVTAVAATPGGLSLKFERPPTPAQQRKIEALLADRERLERLKPQVGGGLGASRARARSDDELLQVLQDPQTSDAAWLRAFRQYALAHLIGRPDA